MSKGAAKTGAGPMASVAMEQFFPEDQRIIKDDMAYRILPFSAKVFVWLAQFNAFRSWLIRTIEKNTPGIWAGMMCRKRYIDDKLIESVDQVDAVVNLGAGFDTRAYRLPALADTLVWEVDQPEIIRNKKKLLRQVFETLPSHVNLVSMDFDREALDAVLASNGYAADMRTFFIMEGVTQYLTEAGISSTFDFLAKAARGSRLAFTYVRKDFLDGREMYGWEKGHKKYVVKDKLWLFGMDPDTWPEFLQKFGWRVVEDTGYEDLAKRYIEPTGRQLSALRIERMLYAEKL